MMKEANAMFREATGHIAQRMLLVDEDHMVRRKYSEHDIQQAKESEERALDVARNIFEVVSHYAASNYMLTMYNTLFMLTSPRSYRIVF